MPCPSARSGGQEGAHGGQNRPFCPLGLAHREVGASWTPLCGFGLIEPDMPLMTQRTAVKHVIWRSRNCDVINVITPRDGGSGGDAKPLLKCPLTAFPLAIQSTS